VDEDATTFCWSVRRLLFKIILSSVIWQLLARAVANNKEAAVVVLVLLLVGLKKRKKLQPGRAADSMTEKLVATKQCQGQEAHGEDAAQT
jgi:hypothetical protein